VTQPIFTAGRLESTVQVSQAQREEPLIQYEKTIQTAFMEVSNALVAHQRMRENREQQEFLETTLVDRVRLAWIRSSTLWTPIATCFKPSWIWRSSGSGSIDSGPALQGAGRRLAINRSRSLLPNRNQNDRSRARKLAFVPQHFVFLLSSLGRPIHGDGWRKWCRGPVRFRRKL
jgi:hypothetical protein